MRVETRPASAEDAPFLAWVMREAARSHLEKGVWDLMFPGEDEPRLEILEKLATTERVHPTPVYEFLVALVIQR